MTTGERQTRLDFSHSARTTGNNNLSCKEMVERVIVCRKLVKTPTERSGLDRSNRDRNRPNQIRPDRNPLIQSSRDRNNPNHTRPNRNRSNRNHPNQSCPNQSVRTRVRTGNSSSVGSVFKVRTARPFHGNVSTSSTENQNSNRGIDVPKRTARCHPMLDFESSNTIEQAVRTKQKRHSITASEEFQCELRSPAIRKEAAWHQKSKEGKANRYSMQLERGAERQRQQSRPWRPDRRPTAK